MKVENKIFTPELLQSEFRLRQFLKGEQAIQEITKRAKEKPYAPALYYNRWQVALIVVTSPLQLIFFAFLKAISSILKCVGAISLSIRCEILSKHSMYHIENVSEQWSHGKNFLCPSINTHDLRTSDVYLQPKIPAASIQDKWVKDKVQNDESHVKFYHQDGLCRGSADWFLYLFKETQGKFSSPHQHVKAVAEQFKKGGSREAAVLHSLDSPKLFSYQKRIAVYQDQEEADEAIRFLADKEHTTEFLKDIPYINTPEHGAFILDANIQTKEVVESLDPGIYAIGFKTHKVAYIKIHNELGFIFDSNTGATCFEGKGAVEKATAVFDKYMKKSKLNILVIDQLDSDPQEEISITKTG